MPDILRRFPMTSSLLVWALVWELVGRLGLIQLLPPFTSVLGAMGEVVPTGTFARAAAGHGRQRSWPAWGSRSRPACRSAS